MKVKPKAVFRKTSVVGATDAEEDVRWLKQCFVDTGQIQMLRDMSNPARIVVGRTGEGKSALLLRLKETTERVIWLEPTKLSIPYVSNSPILRYLTNLGINVELFYKLLWRHCFCVELLRRHFEARDNNTVPLTQWLKAMFRGSKHLAAIDYLEKWGNKFFEDSDVVVRETLARFETMIGADVQAKLAGVGVDANAKDVLTTEEKQEIKKRVQNVMPELQARQVTAILELTDAVLSDEQKPYYICIDRLDEEWVEDPLRYGLIMALLDTTKEFKRVRHAKVIVATRVDLLRRVFDNCRGEGFQEEKFEALYLRLGWTRDDLVKLLEERVNVAFADWYAEKGLKRLTVNDVLRSSGRDFRPVDYLIERTLYRPRDVIAFFNECIAAAEGSPAITKDRIHHAEKKYSDLRLRSLADEWRGYYPAVDVLARILLDRQSAKFRVADINPDEVRSRCVDQLVLDGPDIPGMNAAANNKTDTTAFIRRGLGVLCSTGAIGLKLRPDESYTYAPEKRAHEISASLDDDMPVVVHPMLRAALHIRPDK